MANQVQHKEVDFTQVVAKLKQNKKLIFISTGILTLLSIIYSLVATPIYTAAVLINPPRLSEAGSGISNPLAALSQFSGGMYQKTDLEVAIALLKTKNVADMIINNFKLIPIYKTPNLEKASSKLSKATEFKPDSKSGFLEIDVSDKSPKLAADIANFYTVSLGQLISNIAYNSTIQKVKFFEEQIPIAKKALDIAGDNLKKFSKEHGILAGQQAQVIVGLSTELQSELVVAQSQLQSMTAYATPDNPDYKQLQITIAALKLQLSNLSGSTPSTQDKISIPAGLAPDYAQEWLRLNGEVSIRENIYRLLLQQYESAKLDKLSDIVPTPVQVVDYARIPLERTSPKRFKIVFVTLILSILLNITFIIFKNRKIIIISRSYQNNIS